MFRDLMNDRIVVHKKDGTVSNTLMAVVSSKCITTDHNGILIEAGDLIVRTMSNGAEETFVVIDPGFHEIFHGIPAGYQMKVRNLNAPEAKAAMSNIHIHINGDNNRVNQNSIDNSLNVSTTTEVNDLFEQIRKRILEAKLSGAEADDAAGALIAIKELLNQPKPNKKLLRLMFDSIPHVADIATLSSMILALIPSAY